MSIIEKAIAWALGIANDPAHGYDQASRWGPNFVDDVSGWDQYAPFVDTGSEWLMLS